MTRHGFANIDSPREGGSAVKMTYVMPIHVAAQLGDHECLGAS